MKLQSRHPGAIRSRNFAEHSKRSTARTNDSPEDRTSIAINLIKSETARLTGTDLEDSDATFKATTGESSRRKPEVVGDKKNRSVDVTARSAKNRTRVHCQRAAVTVKISTSAARRSEHADRCHGREELQPECKKTYF